jgi:hypothetical protein
MERKTAVFAIVLPVVAALVAAICVGIVFLVKRGRAD